MSNVHLQRPCSTDSPRLLDRVRARLRLAHYAEHTETAYVRWIRRYILFHGKRHPASLSKADVEQFLTHLAVVRRVGASTQSQALSALLFLYKEVLQINLPWLGAVARAKTPSRLPVVLSPDDVRRLLAALVDPDLILIAGLLYGSGLRLSEVVNLRISHMDLVRRELRVRAAKGGKDRVTLIPACLVERLEARVAWCRALYKAESLANRAPSPDVDGLQSVTASADTDFGRGYLFPAPSLSVDARTGTVIRGHVGGRRVQRAIKAAAERAGINQPVSPHTLRHCFATHLIEAGYDIRTVQELLGHTDVSTTMIYIHVLNSGDRVLRSPLDGC